MMPITKTDVAKTLAEKHYKSEPGITSIFTILGNPEVELLPGEPIKLLEVNADTIPAGILPLGFDAVPASGIPYPTIIIEVTPEEWERIKKQELALPHGWMLGVELPRSKCAENGNE